MKHLLFYLTVAMIGLTGCDSTQVTDQSADKSDTLAQVVAAGPSFKSVLHKANTRGETRASWLIGKHTFSFNRYYDPDRMSFGLLRVLNDDWIAGGGAFPMHPHENMEIVTIQLEGGLVHQDNNGGQGVISENEVQAMSAGTGIRHSEANASKTEACKLLQTWVFPRQMGLKPRYDQRRFEPEGRQNEWQVLASPEEGEALYIHQQAVYSRGDFDAEKTVKYPIRYAGNGVYAFVLEGQCKINGQSLEQRDGFGVWDTDAITVEMTTDTELLLIEVPMISKG
jgi:redox-sensitive bicupin YhaK (pirin superfamily)